MAGERLFCHRDRKAQGTREVARAIYCGGRLHRLPAYPRYVLCYCIARAVAKTAGRK